MPSQAHVLAHILSILTSDVSKLVWLIHIFRRFYYVLISLKIWSVGIICIDSSIEGQPISSCSCCKGRPHDIYGPNLFFLPFTHCFCLYLWGMHPTVLRLLNAWQLHQLIWECLKLQRSQLQIPYLSLLVANNRELSFILKESWKHYITVSEDVTEFSSTGNWAAIHASRWRIKTVPVGGASVDALLV